MAALSKHSSAPAFVVLAGLVAVSVVALLLSDGGMTNEADPCHGHGYFLSTGSWGVDDSTVRVVEQAGLGIDVEAGETRETRTCRVGDFETVTIDAESGVIIGRFTDIGAMLARATEQPQGTPQAVLDMEEFLRRSYVPAELPAVDFTAACDPTWAITRFAGVGASMCHPAEWQVTTDNENYATIEANSLLVSIYSYAFGGRNTDCANALAISVPSGAASVCARSVVSHNPDIVSGLVYGVLLPSSREVVVTLADADSPEGILTAFQIAASVQDLP